MSEDNIRRWNDIKPKKLRLFKPGLVIAVLSMVSGASKVSTKVFALFKDYSPNNPDGTPIIWVYVTYSTASCESPSMFRPIESKST